MKLGIARIGTPVGEITLVAAPDGLCVLGFDTDRAALEKSLARRFGGDFALDTAVCVDPYVKALRAYFDGDLRAIDPLPVVTGGTPFQRRVWARLRRIPAGRTLGYGEMARDLGVPGGARAVGLANGSNPLAIVIPCHRVIAADGTLGGYGGGLDRKRWLLVHEGARVAGISNAGDRLF